MLFGTVIGFANRVNWQPNIFLEIDLYILLVWMCCNLYFNLFRMQKMLLYTWEGSGWEAARSELTGRHGNHQPPKVHKKVRPSCNALLCLISCASLFNGGIKHNVAKIMSLNYIFS